MFISKQEKVGMLSRIVALESRVEQLARSLNAALDTKTTRSEKIQKTKTKAQRNAYARDYYHRVVKPKKAKETA